MRRLVPRAALKVIDTATGFGIAGPLVKDVPTTVRMSATAVPAGTTGLVLSVQTRGTAGSGALTVVPTDGSSEGRSADVVASVWTTDLVVVPVGADRALTLTSTAGADVRATIVGYLR